MENASEYVNRTMNYPLELAHRINLLVFTLNGALVTILKLIKTLFKAISGQEGLLEFISSLSESFSPKELIAITILCI